MLTLGDNESIVTNVPLFRQPLGMGEDMHEWGQRVYKKYLYFLLNFAVNLKLR